MAVIASRSSAIIASSFSFIAVPLLLLGLLVAFHHGPKGRCRKECIYQRAEKTADSLAADAPLARFQKPKLRRDKAARQQKTARLDRCARNASSHRLNERSHR